VHLYVYTDGTLMNTTRERGEPMAIKVPTQEEVKSETNNGKVNPISDAIGMLSIGDSITLVVPIDSSMRAAPQLKDVKELKYAIVMEDLKTQEEYNAYTEERRKAANKDREEAMAKEAEIASQMTDIASKYKSGELKDQIKSTASGLKYMIVEAGTGPEIEPTDQVTVHYYGTLTDGTMFDNSYKRGQPYPVKLGMGQVIKGWDEGIPMLKGGDKAVLFIPSDLAYGSQANGQIPANAELLFFVDVVKVGI
jgi:FKBP-type peptidyl-prolyl cis-trans isomerase